MTIHITTGDLFANEHNAQAFAHGVNCVGVMGAGIAKEFRWRYLIMYREYLALCMKRECGLMPGEVFVWRSISPKPQQPVDTVFNLCTQDGTGPRARYDWLEESLDQMLVKATDIGVTSIAMPAIGCGIGGLEWKRVYSVVGDVCGAWDGDLWLYEPRGK